MPTEVYFVIAAVLVLTSFAAVLAKRYKRCPSNRILVIYGRVSEGRSARCLHGGGSFVWPLIQDYSFLSLDPMQIEIPLRGALSSENIRVNVPSVFTVAVGTEPAVMNNAAERLLGLQVREIMKQAEDIIFGQLRQVIASMAIEDINRDRDKFLESIHDSLASELEKIGLILLNVNITDITDESGYIEAIGRKAASEAIQQAEIDVAVQQKKGAIGVAEAERERMISVAQANKLQDIGTKEAERDKLVRIADLDRETAVGQQEADYQREAEVKQAEREMRIVTSKAESEAVTGENEAKKTVADANASLSVREAEAFQLSETRRREADAAVRQAQYEAEALAAEALARKVEREKRAELEAVAKAEKAKQIVDAEAAAEQVRIDADARAAAIFAEAEARARGEYEALAKKADGLRQIVEHCGGAQQAFQLLMLEQLPQLAETAASAISNIKFDKVVVWDSGKEGGGTQGFLKNIAGSLPPMLHMMRDIGGVEMPEFLGKLIDGETKPDSENASKSESEGADAGATKKKSTPRKPTPSRGKPGTSGGPKASGGGSNPEPNA
ncbi:MAG: SPFH domain-containing protein [Planctomycetota bacterium]